MKPIEAIRSINRYLEDPDERELEGLLRDVKRTMIECNNALHGLLAWEVEQGGWEAPAWKHAKRIVGRKQ